MKRQARISAPYGVKGDWAAGYHTGVDYAVPTGTTVRSVGSGTVVSAGWAGSYGKLVQIITKDGHRVLFAHLSRISVREGTKVHRGTRIGYSGNTGRTTGPHLHFEVRKGTVYGSDINPVSYLRKHGASLA